MVCIEFYYFYPLTCFRVKVQVKTINHSFFFLSSLPNNSLVGVYYAQWCLAVNYSVSFLGKLKPEFPLKSTTASWMACFIPWIAYTLNQGSPTPRPQPTTWLQPVQNHATQVMGKHAWNSTRTSGGPLLSQTKLHSCKRTANGNSHGSGGHVSSCAKLHSRKTLACELCTNGAATHTRLPPPTGPDRQGGNVGDHCFKRTYKVIVIFRHIRVILFLLCYGLDCIYNLMLKKCECKVIAVSCNLTVDRICQQ